MEEAPATTMAKDTQRSKGSKASPRILSNRAKQELQMLSNRDPRIKKTLTHLDISDNQVLLSQLLNLVSLEELDIQYNNLDHLQLN